MPLNHHPVENKGLSSLTARVEAMAGLGILVVGDLMLDRFVYGDVHRISPESPVPVLSIAHDSLMLGGAGNVLSNLHGLGVTPYMIGLIADDAAGADVKKITRDLGADPAHLITTRDRPTTIKTRFLAGHQQLLRTDLEIIRPVTKETEENILAQVKALTGKVRTVILSDYGKGILTQGVIDGTIKLARAAGIPVLVDPKGRDYSIYRGATLVTPNRKELSEATGNAPTKTDEDVVDAARTLIFACGIDAVVATRSQDGMSVIQTKPGTKDILPPVHLRTEALEVFDVSGAGDTVIATIAAALAAGAALDEAAVIANAAGGIVVAKVGTAPVRRAELIDRLNRRDMVMKDAAAAGVRVIDRAREAPVCTAEDAAEDVARWQARGLKVGFTNGCFDILHRGHTGYLNAARDRCDRLVVGLNADESVRRLKGADRPVNDESSRAAVLAALGAVDMVVIFGQDKAEDDKPLTLLRRLKPQLYFKGGDYTEDQLPEAPLVRSWGGEVMIMPLTEGHSTTGTIHKLKAV